MNTVERINKQKALVEEIGRNFDKEGFQPIAGRILGLLMVMDKEQFTFEEIVEELQISKSSASNTLRNLEIRGLIDYVTLPGDRKRYFQIKIRDSFTFIEEMKYKLEQKKAFVEKILQLKANPNSKNAQHFNMLSDVLNFYLEKIQTLKQEYNK